MKILDMLFAKSDRSQLENYIETLFMAKQKQLQIKRHAIEHAIDLIAKTISKSEIQIYRMKKGKISKDDNSKEYYTLNVQPNPNKEATSFFYEVIKKYLDDGEALIVELDGSLYLADTFQVSTSVLLPKVYYNVQISDDHGNSIFLRKTFTSEDVIYLNLKSSKIKETLDSYYEELGNLIGIASSHYKLNNLSKFRLKIPGGQPKLKDPITEKELTYDDYKQKITRGLFDEQDAIILLSDTFGLEKIDFGSGTSSDEWSKLEKKWSDKVAMTFNIPLDIFYGNKTDKSTSTNDFITFGILPHLQIIEDGLNAKIIGESNFLKGERIRINRLNMKHFDILESAVNMDKLFSNGYSHNEINEFIGIPRVDAAWADKHYITKNYENVDLALEGGDENEGTK
ncbi:phage portal protein [Mycoplasma sp. CAG:877]|nr:phage portal protein [Mycoplasma sp. CAG:877]